MYAIRPQVADKLVRQQMAHTSPDQAARMPRGRRRLARTSRKGLPDPLLRPWLPVLETKNIFPTGGPLDASNSHRWFEKDRSPSY